MIVCFPVEKKIKMDWAQPMVYSEEFSRKERPTIEEYDITHDERTDEKIQLDDILLIACWNIIGNHPVN